MTFDSFMSVNGLYFVNKINLGIQVEVYNQHSIILNKNLEASEPK